MIRGEDLTVVRAGRTILDAVSVELPPGGVTVILGPNGAGKTTLVATLAGILVPDRGSVTLDGMPVAAMRPAERARAIGLLPQGGTVAWNLTVETVVALGRLPHRRPFAGPSPLDAAAVERAMAATHVAHLARRRVATLSGGERARVLLARALAGGPRILLADEPMQNLDPRHQLEVAELLQGVASRGAAVGVVLHDLPLARRMADRAILVAGGRCIAGGPAHEVLAPDRLEATFGVALSSELVPTARVG
ncbi:ABC transporter ATP-binding protein [Thermaurantiacus sp.]